MTISFSFPLRLLLTIFLLSLLVAPLSAEAGDSSSVDEEIKAELAKGYELLQRRRVDDAVRAFRKADKLGEKAHPEAAVALAIGYQRLQAWVESEKTARRAIELAGADAYLRSAAYKVLGLTLLARASGKKENELLAEAEGSFRAALESAGGEDPVLKLNLAETVMRLGRDEEGIALLEEFLAGDPTGPSAARARSLLDNPDRSREALVPDFAMVTLKGEYLTPDDFAGEVILLDFWGTWCPPCRKATPALGRLAKRHHDEPFRLVGVSNDSSREVLEQYVADHDITWTQVWDQGGQIGRDSFLVKTYPTYVVLDHQGRVVYRVSGWGEYLRKELERRVYSAIRKARKAEKAQGSR
ncbi:MAG: redoxin domain-containing protein [Acidobacteriota bacterium]